MNHLTNNIEHIIQGCRLYQAAAQQQLYKHCYVPMMQVCMRYTQNRDDAAAYFNAAMLKVFQSIEKYSGTGAFLGWVRRIVVNTCIDNCRKQATYLEVSGGVDEVVPPTTFSHSEIEISSEQVLEWLQLLPKNTALVFNMYCMEGYEIKEVADALQITMGTAKWHVNEARKKLRLHLAHFNTSKLTRNA